MRGYWHNHRHGEPRGYGYEEQGEEFSPGEFYGQGPNWGYGPGPQQGQGYGPGPQQGQGFDPRMGRGFGRGPWGGPWAGRGFGPQFGFGRGPWGGGRGWQGGRGPWGRHGFGHGAWGGPSLDQVIERLEHFQGHLEQRLDRVKLKLEELRTERARRQESGNSKPDAQPAQPGFTETTESGPTAL